MSKEKTKPTKIDTLKQNKFDKKTDENIQKLAKRIREIRKQKGYSNADFFAYDHNISRSQYARYENGEDIRFSSLMKLIKAFDLTPQEFFNEDFS